MSEDEIAAMRAENSELRDARDFYESEFLLTSRVYEELRDSIRVSGFSTQYFDRELRCFPNTVKACKLRDRIAELIYEMARHLNLYNQASALSQEATWSDISRRLLQKLRAIDFQRYQREMERR